MNFPFSEGVVTLSCVDLFSGRIQSLWQEKKLDVFKELLFKMQISSHMGG